MRFKQQVDARVSAGLQSVLGLPSYVTQNYNARDLSSNMPGAEGRESRYDRSSDHHASSPSSSPSSDFDDWIFEQREATANEAVLDRYYEGYGVQEHMRRWQIFAFGSRYSPLRLAMLPEQPCPRDISDGMDPSMFTFVDAFEDLLAESSGRRMMDLQTRYEMNQLLARMWPRGEHPLSWFSRLESQDLSNAYFRYSRGNQHTPARMDDWGELTPEDDRDKMPWGDARETDAQNAERPPLPSPRPEEPGAQTSLFGELDRVFKELGKVLEDEISSFGQGRRPSERHQNKEGQEQDPKTEEDLYSTVQSAYHDAERSLSNFIKSFSGGRWGFEPWRNDIKPSDTNAASGNEIREDESGKTVKSTEEFVDAFGNLHVKTEIRRTDWDGNEVASETHYSVRPVPQTRKVEEESPEKGSREEASPGQDEKKQEDKSGWFWK